MNLQEIRIILSTIIQQRKPTITVSVEQFNALLKYSQLKHFKNCLGLPEEYSPGAWVASRLPEVTRVISESISPFMVYMGKDNEPPLFITNGYATIPSDYYYPLSMRYTLAKPNGVIKDKVIEITTDKRWEEVLSSAVVFPTVGRPYCNFKSNYIQFEPKTIQFAKFSYIRKPADPIYSLKSEDGDYVYDSATSVQLEWKENDILDIMNIMLGELSVPLTRGDIKSISEQVKQKGI